MKVVNVSTIWLESIKLAFSWSKLVLLV